MRTIIDPRIIIETIIREIAMTQAIIGETIPPRIIIDLVDIKTTHPEILTQIKRTNIDLEIDLAVRTVQTETLDEDQDQIQMDIIIIHIDQDQKKTIEIITIEMTDMIDHINLDHIIIILEMDLKTDLLEIEANQTVKIEIHLTTGTEVNLITELTEIVVIAEAEVPLEINLIINLEAELFLMIEIILDKIQYLATEIHLSKDTLEKINQIIVMIVDNQGHFHEIDLRKDHRIRMAREWIEIHPFHVMPRHGEIFLDMFNASLDIIVIHNIIQSHRNSVTSVEFLGTIRSAV